MGFSVFPSESGFNDYRSPGLKHSLNSSSNISVPSGTNMAYAIVINGGGGGNGQGHGLQGDGENTHRANAGNAGNTGELMFGLTPITSSVTVGSGGAGGNTTGNHNNTGSGNTGGLGGISSFGVLEFNNNDNTRNEKYRNAGSQRNPSLYGLNSSAGQQGNASVGGTAGGVGIYY